MVYAELTEEERAQWRAVYDAGFAAGSGRPWLSEADADFVDAVAEDWFTSLETMQALRREPPLPPSEIPAWLRDLDAQARATAPLGRYRDG